jgi:phosphoglycerate kinase
MIAKNNYMKIKSFSQAKLEHKVVLVRVDFNAPFAGAKIKDDFKIRAGADLIKFLSKRHAKILLVTHLGEPNAASSADRKKYSVRFIAKHLSKLLGQPVVFLNQPIGSPKLAAAVKKLKDGQAALLENIRFYKGETANDDQFAKQLADLAEVYINNAFAVSHRQHASVAAIKKYLPSYAGPLLIDEVANLQRVLKPKHPMIAVLGGLKIETKIVLLKNLLKKANHVLVGGALANNFLAARRYNIGRSITTKAGIKLARKLPKKRLVLPIDVVVRTKAGKTAWRRVKEIKSNETIVDIGPETMKIFGNYIKRANTLFWNGPLGKFEDEGARFGTLFVARAIASRSSGKAFGVVGGGETIEALNLTKMADDVDWVSTGGGAALAYLSGERLPGLIGLIK